MDYLLKKRNKYIKAHQSKSQDNQFGVWKCSMGTWDCKKRVRGVRV